LEGSPIIAASLQPASTLASTEERTMSLRRAGFLALPLLVVACTDVTQVPLPADLVFARFSSPNIPLPNDLALAAVPAAPCAALPSLQAQLLCNFKDNGGWPSDQESAITIPFTAVAWDATVAPNGAYVQTAAPAIDLASVTPATVTVMRVDVTPNVVLRHAPDGALPAELEFSSTAGSCTGTGAAAVCSPALLTIRRAAVAGARRWDAGARYVVGVRGGASGVKAGGRVVQADTAVALALVNRDLTKRENQPLGNIPDSNGNGSNADEIAQLEGVRAQLNLPLTWAATGGVWTPAPSASVTPAFTAIATQFPRGEIASAATFGTAPGAVVLIDSGAGVVPLPIDLLRTDADGTVINNPAFGPAAAGLDTLDGFSTTAMLLAQTSSAIRAETVNGANVFLYKLGGAAPERVPELKHQLALAQGGDPTANPFASGYVAEPDAISAPCPAPLTGRCATTIGLQPAFTAPTPVGNVYLPPLAEDTKYAVVITKRVTTATGAPLARTSVAKILLGTSQPLVVGGVSQVPGVSADTATMLQTMRADLAPVMAALPAGTTAADVALAYTFKTQSITGLAFVLNPNLPNPTGISLQLSAAPYSIEAGAAQAVFAVTGVTPVTPPATIPNAAGTFEITFNSLDLIDKTTGTFRRTLRADLANPLPLLTTLKALVVTPDPANVPPCGAGFPPGLSCAKVVVVGHGLGGSKETLWALADSLAARGFIAIATDFPMHGARAWCKADAECGAGGTCTPFPGGAGQGDATPPGTCTAGAPVPAISGQFFISANFFRIRDAFRQNLIDQSALALAMARPPAPQAPQPAQDARALLGLPANVLIDPTAVRWEGISLGALTGTSVLATNPRFDRGVLAVGGTTMVDLFTDFQSVFAPTVDQVFLGLGIDRSQIATNPAVAAAYLRTINVAKWIVDPADPGNFARHVSAAPLPNLLANPAGTVAQAPKDAFGLIAKGDGTIRNPYNELLYSLMGADTVLYQGPAGEDVPHSFLGTSAAAQGHAAAYLVDLTTPASPANP
jgi:hypothetical protein